MITPAWITLLISCTQTVFISTALPAVILLKSPCIDYIKPVSQSVQNQEESHLQGVMANHVKDWNQNNKKLMLNSIR